MNTRNQIHISQLNEKLKPFIYSNNSVVSPKGWVNTICVSINMTLGQLAKSLKMTTQGAKKN